jgi:hypothetical protein
MNEKYFPAFVAAETRFSSGTIGNCSQVHVYAAKQGVFKQIK